MKSVAKSSILNLLIRLWNHLSHRRQRQFLLLTGLMLVSALAEVVSMGAVLPFIGILVAPDQVISNPIVAELAHAWGITSGNQLVLPLTVAFVMAAIIAGLVRIVLLWVSARIAYGSGADLGVLVYRRTLYQPYHVHLARNSSEVISGITSKVVGAVNVLLSLLMLASSTVLLIALMLALITIDPTVALVAALVIGASYTSITLMSRRRLHRNSQCIAHEQSQVVKALQEGLGGIRDVLLDGAQPTYCQIYRDADYALRRAQCNNLFIAGSPRLIMEALGMALIAALAYGLTYRPGGIAQALPVLGALVLGAQRVLPAMQQIYAAWATIAGSYASLEDTVELLDQPLPTELLEHVTEPLHFKKDIQFGGVRFSYTNEGPNVLDSFNLLITKGARVGFVGSTGSGKSTTLDLLMGLLTPTEGEILIDSQPLNGYRLRAWQQAIAHVPQSIYLADTTLAENIAFGVPRDSIDFNRVKQAARQAQIADFIETSSKGYKTHVGERGIRLSGGQRQRIGIARALYKQASVLVFDEATSALDNATERTVMDAIEDLSSDLTILIVAHRLSTVRCCDTIVELEHGKLVAQGTYEELIERSPSFRRMALNDDK